MSRIVLDCSVTVASFFQDEQTPAVLTAMRIVVAEGAVAPSLWRYEVGNALLMAERRKRIDASYRHACLADLSALDIRIDEEGDSRVWTAALRIAEAQALTLYDAAYLELALRLGLPLATLDEQMRAAAMALKVELLGR